ncbi:MAG TPA: putative sugar O-methyltransferase [Edaphobacter sp.]|jgi:putative sugar O-methyltransferase|nr:putative sugar O-methyltransferase [Edaphobacter sp.]
MTLEQLPRGTFEARPVLMVKFKYLRHPFQTANAAKGMLAARLNMWKFGAHGSKRYKNDPRFDLQNVTDGFASHINDSTDDTKLLERICEAYIKSVEQQQFVSKAYEATEWWQQVRQRSLEPVITALQSRDIDRLRMMYRNFFRDPCSAGLLGVPFGMSKAYFGGKIKDFHRRFYLSHALYRLDYWKAQTDGRFELQDLASPEIGNPFGIRVNGTFVRVGSEYAHCCASRICDFLESRSATVVEIGGGFGGMAYYLLRDHADVTYLNFDLPETIALSSYYLLRSFPHLRFLLYGEQELTKEAIEHVDVILMPVFELKNAPKESVDVTFSSHAMSDISSEALIEYMSHIARITRRAFLYIGNSTAKKSISDLVAQNHQSFQLKAVRPSGWHSHKVSGAGVGGAAGVATSTMFEQCFVRTDPGS